jgi:hypothetical protein
MYCQAVKADKNKRIYAPYGEGRPDWCPLVEIKTPHGRLEGEKVIQMLNELKGELTKDMNGTETELVKATFRVIKSEVGRMMRETGNASTLIEAEE